MKNLMKLFTCLFMVLSLALVSSCSPSDGVDGTNGVDGAPGPQGPAGQDGQDGNANVISSDWIAVNFGPASSFGIYDIVDSNITAANMADAAILVYGKIDANTVIVIPFVFDNRSYYFGLFASSNTLRMIGYSLDGSAETYNDFTDVRFVIIPPGPGFTAGTDSSNKILADLENQGVDVADYESVAAHFNLKQ
jgi:hypothetical protein